MHGNMFVLDSGRVTPSSVDFRHSKPVSQYTSIRLEQQRGDMLNQMNEAGQASSRIFDNQIDGTQTNGQHNFKVIYNDKSEQVLKINFLDRASVFVNLTKLKKEPVGHVSVHSDSLHEDYSTDRLNIGDFLTQNPTGKKLKHLRMKNPSSIKKGEPLGRGSHA